MKKIKKERVIKISDKNFFNILRENGGLYARTARAIERQLGITYTRQSVKERAEKHPEILNDIKEEVLDIAEEGLVSLMRSRNEPVKLDSTKFFLKTKGKSRGYIEKQAFDVELKQCIPIFPDVSKNEGDKQAT